MTKLIPRSAYRLINEDAAKRAYDAFAGPNGRRTTKEKIRDALAAYEAAKDGERSHAKRVDYEILWQAVLNREPKSKHPGQAFVEAYEKAK